jgi:hypothetical protein
MKDTLVESWRNRTRDISQLENFGGLKVSLCTRNAIRARLREVLCSSIMRKYLKSISFPWVSPECEAVHFDSLRTKHSFRNFWNTHLDWQNNVGDAISLCLERLQFTGVDPDKRQLSALWVEEFEDSESETDENEDEYEHGDGARDVKSAGTSPAPPAEQLIVNLFRSEHSWTGLIEDSEECLTMAIMVSACLEYDDGRGYGRRCLRFGSGPCKKKLGYPVLRTRLYPNKSILKSEGLYSDNSDSCRVVWHTDRVKKGACFYLGNQGKLQVLRNLKDLSTLEMEWKPLLSEKLQ